MSQKLPGLSLQDEARLSDKEWIRISDDLNRVIRISEEAEWSAHAITTLRELRIQRFKLDNPEASEDEIISYFPIPMTDEPEVQRADTVLAKVLKDSVINSEQLPADIRESAKDLDAKNADMRSKLLAEIVLSKNFRNLPKSMKKRLVQHPAFVLLSKRSAANAGENEFDFSDKEIEQKARLVAEAFFLRPPADQETAMPAFGSSRTLYAMPTIPSASLDASFIAMKGTTVVIEVSRANCLISLETQTQFFSNLVFAFNLPENRDPANPDLPSPPPKRDQDSFTTAEWEVWANRSELTSLLARLELDKDDCKAKWFEIFRLLRSYRITPILMFASPMDFTMFRLALDLDFLSTDQKDITFAAVIAGSWSDTAISRMCTWVNQKSAFDIVGRRDHFEQLREIVSQAVSAGQSRYVSVVNVERSMMTVSNLPADFNLNSLVYGPWNNNFRARRLWAPSTADMVTVFNGNRPRVYPTVFFATQNIHQVFFDRPDNAQAAEFLNFVWSELTLEFGRQSPETFRLFYHEVELMFLDPGVHESAPTPLSVERPIPIFFNNNRRINEVLTDSPTFVQSLAWEMNIPVSTGKSFLPTLLARVLTLQKELRSEGQIPVSVTPSLELEIGLNPPQTTSIIEYDWRKWAKQERLKLQLFPIWKDFENASKFLPLNHRIRLASHMASFQLGTQGLWPARTPEAMIMLESVWSPTVGEYLKIFWYIKQKLL